MGEETKQPEPQQPTKAEREKAEASLRLHIRVNYAVRKANKRPFPYHAGALKQVAQVVRNLVQDAERRFPWYCPDHGFMHRAVPHGKGAEIPWAWTCLFCSQPVVRVQLKG